MLLNQIRGVISRYHWIYAIETLHAFIIHDAQEICRLWVVYFVWRWYFIVADRCVSAAAAVAATVLLLLSSIFPLDIVIVCLFVRAHFLFSTLTLLFACFVKSIFFSLCLFHSHFVPLFFIFLVHSFNIFLSDC